MSGGPMILAGDVGGTKTNLGLFEREGDRAAAGPFGQVPQLRISPASRR